VIFTVAIILVAIRIFYSIGEIYYEHDWPRDTWKGLALAVILAAVSA
jgi:hypothetical protein